MKCGFCLCDYVLICRLPHLLTRLTFQHVVFVVFDYHASSANDYRNVPLYHAHSLSSLSPSASSYVIVVVSAAYGSIGGFLDFLRPSMSLGGCCGGGGAH